MTSRAATRGGRSLGRRPGTLSLAWLLAWGSPAPARAESLTAQDVRIVAQVLHFSGTAPAGPLRIGVVFDARQPASHVEAMETMAALSDMPSLQPVLVEEDALPDAAGLGALLTTADVRPGPVRAAMQERHLPCLTIHESQARDGTCMVAIRSAPSVTITLNQETARAAGVRFATAFRMMVREL